MLSFQCLFFFFSFQCFKVKVNVKVAQSCPTLCDPNFPAQNTGVGSLSLIQGIFPTQGKIYFISGHRTFFQDIFSGYREFMIFKILSRINLVTIQMVVLSQLFVLVIQFGGLSIL